LRRSPLTSIEELVVCRMLSSEALYEIFAGKDVIMEAVNLNSGSILALLSGWNLSRLVSRVFLVQIPFSVWKSKRLVY